MDVREIIKECCKDALEVCDLVSDYFGEDLVDNNMKDLYSEAESTCVTEEDVRNICDVWHIEILVKFPKVRVTNENGNFVDITNLFVKIPLHANGKMVEEFTMIRTEYSLTQWINNYSHSHLPFYKDYPERFLAPCLGTGPIKDTIFYLKRQFDVQRWGLFCFELSKYVTVESLSGGPYRRLENLGKGGSHYYDSYNYRSAITGTTDMPKRILKVFVKDFIKGYNWKFKFNSVYFTLGEPLLNFWINVSNAFIKWFNENRTKGYFLNTPKIYCKRLFMEYFVTNSTVYSLNERNQIENIHNVQGMELFEFKGVMQKLNITGKVEETVKTRLLDTGIRDYIITYVLKIINSTYGREIKIDSKTEIF